MKRFLVVIALLGAREARAQCPSYTTCSFQPVMGQQPSYAEINTIMEELAVDGLGSRAPDLPQLETGPSRTLRPPRFPCVLFKAIGVVESSWRQFCADTGLTVISFDCGFGISQITSGAATYGSRIATEAAFNIGAGADVLIKKWNGDQTYGGQINESTPTVVEDWYYATWAYNSFSIRNNPNNPEFPSSRPPYGGPGALSRGSYPYQELVWGRVRYPLRVNGADAYSSVEVSYPDNADIPPPPSSGSHLFQQDLTIAPQHDNQCVDPCANGGCPMQTEIVVDNLDPGFSLEGAADTANTGGYRDTFRHAAAVADGAPTVIATFTPDLPSDGVWEIAGWIPLNPATSANIPVRIMALGGVENARMDQSVVGGDWQTLGRAKLRAGHTFVRVRNDSGEVGERIGFDAMRWRWIGFGGSVAQGGACDDSVDCRDSLACVNGACVAPCFEVACTNGMGCDQQTGVCDEQPGTSSSEASSTSAMQGPATSVDWPITSSTSTQHAAGSGLETRPPEENRGCPTSCGAGEGPELWMLVAAWLVFRRRDVPGTG